MKKIVIVGSIIIIVVVVGGYFGWRAIFSSRESTERIVTVNRGKVIENVSVTGTVVSAKQIDLEFENSGKIRKIETAVGERVKDGQVLVRLDSSELNAQLLSSRAALDIAQAKLVQTLAGNRPEDIQVYQAAVDKAKTEVENKKQALIDAQADAENDLIQAYEDIPNTLNDAYLKANDAVHKQIDELFSGDESNNPQLTFTTVNSQAENDAEWQRVIAGKQLTEFQNEIIALNTQDYESLDKALIKAKEHLTIISNFLARVGDALYAAIVTSEVTLSELSTYKTNLTTGRTNVNTALTNITTQEQAIAAAKVNNKTSVNTAKANLDTAEAALKKARDELTLKKAGPRQSDIDLAEAEVSQAQANLLQIQAKINKSVLKAPTAGTITAIEKEEGEMAQANSTIVSMISSGHFQVEANVSETEIAKVDLADMVSMTLDALGPNEKFPGRIIKIDPAETVVSGVIYYKVTSVFDAEDERIKPGMTVNLDIQTAQRENVLYLPYYVVKEKNGQKYVLVLEGKEIKEKIVKTGLEGENRIEIIEGLTEGEKVTFGQD